jgi:uncharacterized protein YeaO (DUF488 family)
MASADSSTIAWDRFFTKYRSSVGSKGPRKAQSMRDIKASIANSRAAGKTESDWDDCTNKLRRLVLIEGVPEEEVRGDFWLSDLHPLTRRTV